MPPARAGRAIATIDTVAAIGAIATIDTVAAIDVIDKGKPPAL
jgi:hypothetical protein